MQKVHMSQLLGFVQNLVWPMGSSWGVLIAWPGGPGPCSELLQSLFVFYPSLYCWQGTDESCWNATADFVLPHETCAEEQRGTLLPPAVTSHCGFTFWTFDQSRIFYVSTTCDGNRLKVKHVQSLKMECGHWKVRQTVKNRLNISVAQSYRRVNLWSLTYIVTDQWVSHRPSAPF